MSIYRSIRTVVADILRGRVPISRNHKIYGKIYYPFYNLVQGMPTKDYDLYDKNGNKLDVYFLRDVHMAHEPVRLSDYFIFDRYNYGLKTHFYSHKSMLQTMGKPDKKYGFLVESEAIVPDDYKIFKKHKTLNQDFDLIFTYSADILDKIDNARFVPFCAFNNMIGKYQDDRYLHKTKNISMLSSKKSKCELHQFRINLAFKCKSLGIVDTYGTFDGGPRVEVEEDAFKDYRFAVCVENDIQPYYFTERLISLFAMQTIPIYLGATEIDKFFNPDGIIKINQKSDIEKILRQCTKEEYENRLQAVLDNYERSKKYTTPFNYMYEQYFKKKGI